MTGGKLIRCQKALLSFILPITCNAERMIINVSKLPGFFLCISIESSRARWSRVRTVLVEYYWNSF